MNHVNEDATGPQPPHQQIQQPNATDSQPPVISDLTRDCPHDTIQDSSIQHMISKPKDLTSDMCDPHGVTLDAMKLEPNVTRDATGPLISDCDLVNSKDCPPNDTTVTPKNEEKHEGQTESNGPIGGNHEENSKEELLIDQVDMVNKDDTKIDGAKVVGAKEKSKQKKSKSKQRSDDESSSDSDSDSDDSSSDSDSDSSSSVSTSSKSGTTSSTTDSSSSDSSSSSSESETETPSKSKKKEKKKKR